MGPINIVYLLIQPPDRLLTQIKNAEKKKRIFAKVKTVGVSTENNYALFITHPNLNALTVGRSQRYEGSPEADSTQRS